LLAFSLVLCAAAWYSGAYSVDHREGAPSVLQSGDQVSQDAHAAAPVVQPRYSRVDALIQAELEGEPEESRDLETIRDRVERHWAKYGMSKEDVSDVFRLKMRLRSELYAPKVWDPLFQRQKCLISCCYTPYVDLVFDNVSFVSDVEQLLATPPVVDDTVVDFSRRAMVVYFPVPDPKRLLTKLLLKALDAGQDSKLFRNAKFVFVTSGFDRYGSPFFHCASDASRTNAAEIAVLDHDQVHAWWVTNHECHYSHPKLYFLPLGATEFCCSENAYVSMSRPLKQIRSEIMKGGDNALPMDSLIFLSVGLLGPPFKVSHRENVIAALNVSFPDVINTYNRRMHLEFYTNISKAAFGASPRGIASSCYRHYHTLLGAAVPVVDYHHTLEIIWDGLPVIFVRDWKDVDAKFLAAEARRLLKVKRFRWEKLFMEFWVDDVYKSASLWD